MNGADNTRTVVGMYAFRTSDPRRLGAFWAELMDLPVSEHSTDELVMLDFDHRIAPVTWLFQRDESVGTEPSSSGRISLDLGHEDAHRWRDVAERAEQAGARRTADREENGIRWIEMTDPDGNPFRIFGPRPA